MAKRILVTGSNGYIGSHVVTALLDRGAQVIAADLAVDHIDTRATTVVADIFTEDTDIMHKLGDPDVCLHMAWKDGFIHNSNAHMECLSAHYTFLDTVMKSSVKQIAVMGSMHEVGYWEGAINDDTPTNPINLYGIAKDALRRALFILQKTTPVTVQWLRAFYILGDDARNHSIFAKIIEAAKSGQKAFPFNDGSNKYDFIHVDELAKQIAASVLQEEVTGIINCCTGQPVSLGEKVESFIKQHGLDLQLQYGAFPNRPYDSPALWGDNEKITKIMKNMR